MAIPHASINILPYVNDTIPVYFTVIGDDNTFNQGVVTSLSIMYGKAQFPQTGAFIPLDNQDLAILVTASFGGNDYIDILYLKALNRLSNANNFARLSQKIPLGIFTDIDSNTIIGNDVQARASMIDDYNLVYLSIAKQVYSSEYSPELEYEYNGTVGLLSNSAYVQQLFLLFSRLANVRLINYDLELFISQYIYYRLGMPAGGDGYAVYIDDNIKDPSKYWILGVPANSILGSTTILAPNSFNEVLKNLQWVVFNAGSFTDEFKQEITNLILRISRADMGNFVTFNDAISPSDDGFSLVGATYPSDPRLLVGRCLEFIGEDLYPLNIIGYKFIE